jgi:putative transcriptional regulator
MKKEIPFNENDLIAGLGEALSHAQGKLTLKTAKLPAHAKPISPAAISQIRKKLHASTPVFAAYLNVNPDTVRSWEKGRRVPSGPALRLLQIAKKQPQILASA